MENAHLDRIASFFSPLIHQVPDSPPSSMEKSQFYCKDFRYIEPCVVYTSGPLSLPLK